MRACSWTSLQDCVAPQLPCQHYAPQFGFLIPVRFFLSAESVTSAGIQTVGSWPVAPSRLALHRRVYAVAAPDCLQLGLMTFQLIVGLLVSIDLSPKLLLRIRLLWEAWNNFSCALFGDEWFSVGEQLSCAQASEALRGIANAPRAHDVDKDLGLDVTAGRPEGL